MENDLIRRSELLAKKCIIRGHLDPSSPCPTKISAIPVDVIERAPSVDAVEAVRCKDCKLKEMCVHHNGSHIGQFDDNDFCSYGERKEGAED